MPDEEEITYADKAEGEDDDHAVPPDLLDFHEVLEWEAAVLEAGGQK